MAYLQTDPVSIRFSLSLYTLMLKAYPAGFRREYGPLMLQVFGDSMRAALKGSGWAGLMALWGRTVSDWLKTLIEESLQRDTAMTRSKFIRLSGWGMMLAADGYAIAILSDVDIIRTMLYQYLGPPIGRTAFKNYVAFSEGFAFMIGFFAILLLLCGLHGIRLRYGESMGRLGRDSLSISNLSGVVAIAGIFSLPFSEAAWSVFVLGLGLQFFALAVFGIHAISVRLMPRGNFLPLSAGIYFPTFILVSIVYGLLNEGAWIQPPAWLETLFVLLSMASLAMLGYQLQADEQKNRQAY